MPGKTLGVKRKRGYKSSAYERKPKMARTISLSAAVTSVPRSSNILGLKTKRCKLLYGDSNYALDYTLAVFGKHIFQAIGLFDPDRTGVGHQPRGFDQMMQMFEKYVVMGVKVELWPAPPNPDGTTQPTIVGIHVGEEDFNSTVLNADDILELANCTLSKNVMAPTESSAGTLSGSNNTEYISTYIDVAKFKGLTKQQLMASEKNHGTSSANPADPLYITCFAGTIGGGSATATAIRAAVRITYDVVFFEPKLPPVS